MLLVEDNPDHAQLALRSLQEHRVSHTVDHVSDGDQALAYLRRQAPYTDCPRPDVVLLDLKLPKVDGHQVLAAIKQDDSLQSIPVVIVSTSDAEGDIARAYRQHANSYLIKPLDFEKFRQMFAAVKYYWGLWNTHPSHDRVETADRK